MSSPSEGGATSDPSADSLPVEHLFTLTANVARAATIKGVPAGTRVVVNCASGTFEGPRMRGIVEVPSGDWVLVGADGTMRLDVRLLLRTDDGADILMTYRGVSSDGGSSIRAAPTFESGDERYAWLNSVQGVATGTSGAGQVVYDVYRLL